MNKKNILIGCMILVISILFILLMKTNNELRYQQGDIDRLFRSNLDQALNGFNFKYNEMKIEDKEYHYTKARVGIDSAMQLLTLTSYEKEDVKLNHALYALQYYMHRNSPLQNEVDYDINTTIYNLIIKLNMDLTSEEKAEELENYINSLD